MNKNKEERNTTQSCFYWNNVSCRPLKNSEGAKTVILCNLNGSSIDSMKRQECARLLITMVHHWRRFAIKKRSFHCVLARQGFFEKTNYSIHCCQGPDLNISRECAVHSVHFSFAIFATILSSHAVRSSCYDFCSIQYKDLIAVMAREKKNRYTSKQMNCRPWWQFDNM